MMNLFEVVLDQKIRFGDCLHQQNMLIMIRKICIFYLTNVIALMKIENNSNLKRVHLLVKSLVRGGTVMGIKLWPLSTVKQ